MKKILTLILIAAIFMQASSQNQNRRDYDNGRNVKTIFREEAGNGGYGGLSLGFTRVGDRDALLTGGRVEWIIGQSLGLGIGGFGFINDPEFNATDNLYYNLSGGYGGFIFEPILRGRWPVHISMPCLLGSGAIARTSFTRDLFTQMNGSEAYLEEASLFLVAEPGLELEFNLVQWMRLAFFGSYRFTTNLHMIEVEPDALIGWNAGITLKIGIF